MVAGISNECDNDPKKTNCADDDCSADPQLYDPEATALGALSEFRCAAQGIACSAGPLDGTPGTYEQCGPRADGLLSPVQEYADFLKSLKANPHSILIGAILGESLGSVTVGVDGMGAPVVEPSCVNGTYTAQPSVRLTAFAEEFPQRFAFSSACESTGYEDALLIVPSLYARTLGYPCFAEVDGTDINDMVAGRQIDCAVYDRTPEGDIEVPRCVVTGPDTIAPTSPLPCWWAYEDDIVPDCSLRVAIERAQQPVDARSAILACPDLCAVPAP